MFLLNRKTELMLLIFTIGILLSQVYIQPAQGLSCYACESCPNNTLGGIKRCSWLFGQYCVWGERELQDGTRVGVRNCGSDKFVERSGYNCETFQPEVRSSFLGGAYHTGAKIRICSCQTDLCNGNYTDNRAQNQSGLISENATASFSSSQPIFVAVSVCVSGLALIK
ncbi:Lymphocyte antigen 6I [Orchesella cincta]|uniref:Lymphocyte antigen 6I n=1 Tax=Orchesella cincta TaxID=48709 RepID=A0A1D2M3H6_ORCCI|nr:Lymphocyte antigen 6I [Orchesella cincta]